MAHSRSRVTVCFSTCGARRIRPCPLRIQVPPTGDPRLGSFGPRHGRPGGSAGGIRPLGEIRARTQCGSRFGDGTVKSRAWKADQVRVTTAFEPSVAGSGGIGTARRHRLGDRPDQPSSTEDRRLGESASSHHADYLSTKDLDQSGGRSELRVDTSRNFHDGVMGPGQRMQGGRETDSSSGSREGLLDGADRSDDRGLQET